MWNWWKLRKTKNFQFTISEDKICSKGFYDLIQLDFLFRTKFLICFLLYGVSIFETALQFKEKKRRKHLFGSNPFRTHTLLLIFFPEYSKVLLQFCSRFLTFFLDNVKKMKWLKWLFAGAPVIMIWNFCKNILDNEVTWKFELPIFITS